MTAIALICGVIAFALFAASTDDHHQRRFGSRPSARRKRRLRVLAWASVIACFACAIVASGWIYGPVLWLGLLMLGAGIVFLSLNLIPASGRVSPARPAPSIKGNTP